MFKYSCNRNFQGFRVDINFSTLSLNLVVCKSTKCFVHNVLMAIKMIVREKTSIFFFTINVPEIPAKKNHYFFYLNYSRPKILKFPNKSIYPWKEKSKNERKTKLRGRNKYQLIITSALCSHNVCLNHMKSTLNLGARLKIPITRSIYKFIDFFLDQALNNNNQSY